MNDFLKRTWKSIKKHWISVWLIATLVIIASIVITNAAYTEVSVVKRVVSTSVGEGELFSSNCMKQDISSVMLTSRQYTVTICNFDQDKPLSFNPAEITYKFYAELQVKIGTNYYTMSELHAKLVNDNAETAETEYQNYVNKIANNYSVCKQADDSGNPVSTADGQEHLFTSSNGFKVGFEGETLAAEDSSTDMFRITVAEGDLSKTDPDFYVHVWAVRTSGSPYTIASRIYGAVGSQNASSWHGTLQETNCATVDYDFYNYVITGNGSGEVDILWNDNYFDINAFFFSPLSGNTFKNNSTAEETIAAGDAKYGSSVEDGKYVGWKKITIVVDSVDDKSRYELQLYKKLPNTSYTDKTASGGVDETASKFIECFYNP